MSKTPRTDAEFKLEAFFDGAGIVETVLVEFARKLETEIADKEKQLAEARAEIENLKWQKAKAEAALELNGKALELVNEARAEIERLKDILYARGQELTELDNKYHAERESDGEVIEQMREALRAWVRTPDIPLHEAIKATEAALEAAEKVG